VTTYSFTVPGTPIPKARPRRDSRSNRFYTPDCTGDYETRIRSYASLARVRPIEGLVRLELRIFLPDERTRDDDNVEKSIRDALQQRTHKNKRTNIVVVTKPAIAFKNDRVVRQVLKLVEIDRKNPRVEVTLIALEAQ
jgi:Holliday junction resolvase RusA-like endonuclease